MATVMQNEVGSAKDPAGFIAGYTTDTALEMWADAIIDNHRFADRTDRALSLVEDVDTLFPDAEELRAQGADVVMVAQALEAGLNPAAFGLALSNGLDLPAFMQTLREQHIDTINEGLEHRNEQHQLEELHPDIVDRILHQHGECSCR